MDKAWVPLHVHSEYSALDGAIKVSPLVRWCGLNGVPAAAVTDHGVMSGHVDLDVRTKGTPIKPIFGCELYATSIAGDPFWAAADSKGRIFHLLALAINQKGYRNLMKMVTASHRNFRRKPITTRAMIEEFGEGIIFSTACIEGELPGIFASDDTPANKADRARAFADTMISIVGRDRFFVELLDIGDRDALQHRINGELNDFASSHGLRTIMTTDSHYFSEDAAWHDYILAAQVKRTIFDKNRLSLEGFDLSLRTPEHMWERWGQKYPEALRNTVEVASMVERFEMSPENFLLPHVGSEASLPELARSGLEQIFQTHRFDVPTREAYRGRLEDEMKIVFGMGFEDYFLMVHDVVAWAKKQGIMVGPGRGSAAGSLMAWSLGITAIDPIRFNLIFERFLNPSRLSMPDIDLDFEDERRGEVIDYLQKRYGENAVSPIINYSRPDWKQSLRDAARVCAFEPGWSDKLVKSLEGIIGLATPHSDDEETVRVAQEMIEKASGQNLGDENVEKVVNLASKMKGLLRHYGRHAAGMIIAPGDITDYVPLCNLKGDMVAQYDMAGVDYMKMVKMDILGLSTLSTIRRTIEYSRQYDPSTPDMDTIVGHLNRNGTLEDMASEIPMDDRDGMDGITRKSMSDTVLLLAQGDSTGVFQLASTGMRKLLLSVRPRNIDELSALIALYRPGPLNSGMTKAYCSTRREKEIRSRKGDKAAKAEVIATFPESVRAAIENIASDTEGIIVYQEHVIRTAQELAGYTAGQADLLRRAMGKKKASVMSSEREHFVEAASKRGIPASDADDVFEKLAYFSGYGFNKSHSTAYAFLAFITAWYKANRPQPFWAALLCEKSAKKQEEFVPFLREASRRVRIIPPAISSSDRILSDCAETSILLNTASRVVQETLKKGGGGEVWNLSDAWSVRLGLGFLKGWSGKKIESIDGIAFDKITTVQDLLRYLILDDKGKTLPPGSIGALFLSGVFDQMLGQTMAEAGRKLPPYRLRLEMVGLNTERFDRKVPGSDMTLYSALYRGVQGLTAKTEQAMNGEMPFKVQQTNGFWGSYINFVVSGIRKKMGLKRPWADETVEIYLQEHVFPVIDCLISMAEESSTRLASDYPSRVAALQTLYLTEREWVGESVTMPSWRLAAEMMDYRFTLYADEATTMTGYFNRLAREGANTPLDKAMLEGGVWIIGYFSRLWFDNSGNAKMILTGRWGDYSPSLFVGVSREVARFVRDNRNMKQGEMVAVRAVRRDWSWDVTGGTECVAPVGVNTFLEGDTAPVKAPQAPGSPVFVRIFRNTRDPRGEAVMRYLAANSERFHGGDFASENVLAFISPRTLEEETSVRCQRASSLLASENERDGAVPG